MQKGFLRSCEQEFAPKGQVSFADGYPFLLASEDSLAQVNKQLSDNISVRHFRPNIVVEGGGVIDTYEYFHQHVCFC